MNSEVAGKQQQFETASAEVLAHKGKMVVADAEVSSLATDADQEHKNKVMAHATKLKGQLPTKVADKSDANKALQEAINEERKAKAREENDQVLQEIKAAEKKDKEIKANQNTNDGQKLVVNKTEEPDKSEESILNDKLQSDIGDYVDIKTTPNPNEMMSKGTITDPEMAEEASTEGAADVAETGKVATAPKSDSANQSTTGNANGSTNDENGPDAVQAVTDTSGTGNSDS